MTIEQGTGSGFNLESERNDPSTFVVDRLKIGTTTRFRATLLEWEELCESKSPQLVQVVYEHNSLEELLIELKARTGGELIPIFKTTQQNPVKQDHIIFYEWPPQESSLSQIEDRVIPFSRREVNYWTTYYNTGQLESAHEDKFTRTKNRLKRMLADTRHTPSPQSSLQRYRGGILDPSSVR